MISNKNLVAIALILIVILFFLSHNLYSTSNYNHNTKNYLNFTDTIKNIFGFLPDFNMHLDIEKKKRKKKDKPKSIEVKDKPESIEVKDKPESIEVKDKKEVFNIDSNNFTYADAAIVCKALDSKLATYNQVLNAHKDGAHWCNYGWSNNQLALYPTQNTIWKDIQSGPEDSKNICGKPGVNGGFFHNKDLKFGVNCYGIKPKADPSKIIYDKVLDSNIKRIDVLQKYKNMVKEKKLTIRPFNTNKWSNYSFKKSSYVINPDYVDDDINFGEIDFVDEENKDPNKLSFAAEEEE
uniref:Link domain-containing protein n=1 Tax=viral metagenome TaxID=1070528 RepID=A0A6C0IX34_9ZZZZ